jgi:hypothetical protein
MALKAEAFIQLGEELLAAALIHGEGLEARGYKLVIEPYDDAYPYSPTFLAKRSREHLFVEVRASLDWSVIAEWCRYGKSCSNETRICFALPEKASRKVSAADMARLQALGAGLLIIDAGGSRDVLQGKDLALNAELPELPPRLRPILGKSYDLFKRGDWRQGFNAACTALEQQAKMYLKSGMSRQRIVVYMPSGKGTKLLTGDRADKLTLGQLAQAFANIQTPNHNDSRIAQVLEKINADRVTVAHFEPGNATRERRLRTNVGRHMFRIVAALRAIKGL